MKISKPSIIRIGKSRTAADRHFARFPKVIYRVTNDFGSSPLGELREARLIGREMDYGLLYHPKGSDPDGCPSFEMAVLDDDKIWVGSRMSWVNVVSFKGKEVK